MSIVQETVVLVAVKKEEMPSPVITNARVRLAYYLGCGGGGSSSIMTAAFEVLHRK